MEYKFTAEIDEKINKAKTDEEKFEIGFTEFNRRIEEKRTSSYIGRAYKALLELMKEGAEWMKNYIFRPTMRLLKDRIIRNTRANRGEARRYSKKCPPASQLKDKVIFANESLWHPNGVQQFYICRLLGEGGNLIYQKIGTTSRDTVKRMVEHIQRYWKEGVRQCVVDKVYEVIGMDSDIVESHFRALYGKRYPEYFKRNDRFTKLVIGSHEADVEFANFMGSEC